MGRLSDRRAPSQRGERLWGALRYQPPAHLSADSHQARSRGAVLPEAASRRRDPVVCTAAPVRELRQWPCTSQSSRSRSPRQPAPVPVKRWSSCASTNGTGPSHRPPPLACGDEHLDAARTTHQDCALAPELTILVVRRWGSGHTTFSSRGILNDAGTPLRTKSSIQERGRVPPILANTASMRLSAHECARGTERRR